MTADPLRGIEEADEPLTDAAIDRAILVLLQGIPPEHEQRDRPVRVAS